jgi:hypothetical protein
MRGVLAFVAYRALIACLRRRQVGLQPRLPRRVPAHLGRRLEERLDGHEGLRRGGLKREAVTAGMGVAERRRLREGGVLRWHDVVADRHRPQLMLVAPAPSHHTRRCRRHAAAARSAWRFPRVGVVCALVEIHVRPHPVSVVALDPVEVPEIRVEPTRPRGAGVVVVPKVPLAVSRHGQRRIWSAPTRVQGCRGAGGEGGAHPAMCVW